MPRFDGTGPNGEGPKTGRFLGNCGLDSNNVNPQGRCLRGNGQGRGFCRFSRINNQENLNVNIEELKNRKQALLEEIDFIERKLDKLV